MAQPSVDGLLRAFVQWCHLHLPSDHQQQQQQPVRADYWYRPDESALVSNLASRCSRYRLRQVSYSDSTTLTYFQLELLVYQRQNLSIYRAYFLQAVCHYWQIGEWQYIKSYNSSLFEDLSLLHAHALLNVFIDTSNDSYKSRLDWQKSTVFELFAISNGASVCYWQCYWLLLVRCFSTVMWIFQVTAPC